MKKNSQYFVSLGLAGLIIFAFNAFAQEPSVDEIIKQAQTPDPTPTNESSSEVAAPKPTPDAQIKPATSTSSSQTAAPSTQAPTNAPATVSIPMPTSNTSVIPGNVNKKLNLEDITVKGELLSDDRMNFVRRQREELKNRIKFRTNFRPEILQEYKN